MEIGATIRHPLLRVAVQVGEATIREACAVGAEGGEGGVVIHVELEAFPDGREGVLVTVTVPGGAAQGRFVMLLRNYFDREALMRVAREAWLRRERFGEAEKERGVGWGCGLN